MATQRRVISVVEGQNGENCDHADRANGGLLASLEKCSQRFRRGLPGIDIVRNGTRRQEVLPAQCHARHAPVERVFREAAPVAAPDEGAIACSPKLK